MCIYIYIYMCLVIYTHMYSDPVGLEGAEPAVLAAAGQPEAVHMYYLCIYVYIYNIYIYR